MRHPRDCRYWKGDTRGCLRDNQCKYLHTSTKKGVNISVKKSYHEPKSGEEKKMDNKEAFTENKGDTDSLNKEVVAKENVIKEKEDIISKLESENEGLIEENHRIKRCAFKMDQEIKVLKPR